MEHVTPIGWAVLGCLGVLFLAWAVVMIVWAAQAMGHLRRERRHG